MSFQPSASRPVSMAMTTGPMIKGAAVTARGMTNSRERFGIVMVPSDWPCNRLDVFVLSHIVRQGFGLHEVDGTWPVMFCLLPETSLPESLRESFQQAVAVFDSGGGGLGQPHEPTPG